MLHWSRWFVFLKTYYYGEERLRILGDDLKNGITSLMVWCKAWKNCMDFCPDLLWRWSGCYFWNKEKYLIIVNLAIVIFLLLFQDIFSERQLNSTEL